jgi:excisionase family DNA binding protein
MLGTVLPQYQDVAPGDERAAYVAVARLLAEREGLEEYQLVAPDGEVVALPAPLVRLLREAAGHLAHDRLVSIVASEQELTTQQAADLLQVSRPHLISLLERGELPYSRPGAHRRIKYADLLAYKARRERAEAAALDELAQLSQDLGQYE